MIVSVNWLKKFVDIDIPVDQLATLIGERLVEIESVEDLSVKYKDVIVVKVIEASDVEGSDHLHLTKVDDGGKLKNVVRDASGYVQVVCGAPNVRVGMLAAWLPPESTVPETYGDKEPFVLGTRKLQGFDSNGMLASAKELDLYEDHTGILEVDKDAAPGTSFAELYELDDYLLDIENKSLTHRPDAFGIVGFAREVAGIQGKQFTTPAWLTELEPTIESDGSVDAPTITIDDPSLSDRFQAVVLSDANEAAQSPIQIQTYLSRSGIRPISAVVDTTNYMMLLAGRPLHAFDYDKFLAVAGGKAEIHVRLAKKGETLKLLNGTELQLDPEDMVVAAGNTVVSLAGAMGGLDTEIDSSTKRILLECATFDLYRLRNMQMRHGVFTEAITRLTKGLPGALGAPVLAESVNMMAQLSGAKVASPVGEDYPGKHDLVVVEVENVRINSVLGTEFASADIKELLENVEFSVEITDQKAIVTVPYWRNDIHIAEDIIEEVGRLSGFDTINPTLPSRDFTAVRPSNFDELRTHIRSTLVRGGVNEVLTYSFIHGDVMKKAGQNPDNAYRLTNSISPELQYYRQSLIPSLLVNIHPNIKAGYGHFALFEMNKFHTKQMGLTDENVPKELDGLAFVVANSKKGSEAAYYEAKRHLDYLAAELHLEFTYEPLEADSDFPVTQPFEPSRSARVWDAKNHERIGVIGEFKRSVQKNFKLPEHSAGFEVSPRILSKLLESEGYDYQAMSKYPGTERDICFQVASGVAYQRVIDTAYDALKETTLISSIEPVDIYQPDSGETKNITIRIKLGSYEKTLTGEEVAPLIESLTQNVTKALNATVI
ncbi:MAG: pheT [Candidatus Saccharibacteria bacterium]|nr:pheT [Candidatus Saccharibacteria bacterium]